MNNGHRRRRDRQLLGALAAAVAVACSVVSTVQAPPATAAPSLASGWPKQLPAQVDESSPLAVDLDGGGVDILFGSIDGRVYAVHGTDGSDVAGWPVQTSNGVQSSPSAADVDGDGRLEVFVGSGTAEASGGALYSFEHDGTQRFRLTAPDKVFPSPSIFSTPAIGDIDADGSADVSYASLGLLSVWAADHRGGVKPGFPFYVDDTVFSSPALADVDGDGITDFVIGNDSTPGPPVDHRGGFVRAFRGDGTVIWEHKTDEIVRSSPSIGDVDGDGRLDVVVGTGNYWTQNGGSTDDTKVIALDLRTGALKWKRDVGGETMASPTLADVTGDGRLDIVIGTWVGPSPGRVLALDGRGTVLWAVTDRNVNNVLAQIVTADLNGDGAQDPLVSGASGLVAFNGRTGAHLWTIAVDNTSFHGSAVITDADGDGLLDIFAAGIHDPRRAKTGRLYRYELSPVDLGRMGSNGWPMFRRDTRRTGSWANVPLTQTRCATAAGAGYHLAASDGGIFSFCRRFAGSTGNIALNQPIVAMAPDPDGDGYWLAASDGGIFAFDAPFRGSTGHLRLASPIVGMAPDRDGSGYYLVAADGGVFAFDAPFRGSTGHLRLASPIVGMATDPDGSGYWLVAADGGIFAFDAPFLGSTGGTRLAQPIVGMTADADGRGYYLVARDGGIFAYDAPFLGSTGAIRLNQPIVGMSADRDGRGYYLVASDGGIFAFDARFVGSTGSLRLNRPIVAMSQ